MSSYGKSVEELRAEATALKRKLVVRGGTGAFMDDEVALEQLDRGLHKIIAGDGFAMAGQEKKARTLLRVGIKAVGGVLGEGEKE